MKRILSVDDEPAMLTCLSRTLKGHGYEILTTSEPEEGLRMLREDDNIVLALLDVCMPKMNGFELYRAMRRFRKLPVLFVTAWPKAFTAQSSAVVEMWEKEFADGTTDIIYKPFNLDVFFEKVEGLIGAADDDTEPASGSGS